jgi:hypothetical protein
MIAMPQPGNGAMGVWSGSTNTVELVDPDWPDGPDGGKTIVGTGVGANVGSVSEANVGADTVAVLPPDSVLCECGVVAPPTGVVAAEPPVVDALAVTDTADVTEVVEAGSVVVDGICVVVAVVVDGGGVGGGGVGGFTSIGVGAPVCNVDTSQPNLQNRQAYTTYNDWRHSTWWCWSARGSSLGGVGLDLEVVDHHTHAAAHATRRCYDAKVHYTIHSINEHANSGRRTPSGPHGYQPAGMVPALMW